jgi:hypothetical protein
MAERNYVFAIKFAVERDVIIKAESLTDAMEKIMDVSPEMILAEIDSEDFVFPTGQHNSRQTQTYPEHDYLYRSDDEGVELDDELLDDKDEV